MQARAGPLRFGTVARGRRTVTKWPPPPKKGGLDIEIQERILEVDLELDF